MLARPVAAPATPNLVDAYRLWTTPDPWQAVESWLSAHPPSGGSPSGSGTAGGDGTVEESDTEFSYPASSAFKSRQLVVSVAPLAHGATGVRVDAQVIWYPTLPATEVVPAADDTVTVSVYEASPGAPTQIVAMKTMTDPAQVRDIAGWVDALPAAVPGTRSCPADSGTAPQLDLVFDGPAGAPTIRVHDDPNGCGGVSFALDATALVPRTDDGLFHRIDQLPGLSLPTVDATP